MHLLEKEKKKEDSVYLQNADIQMNNIQYGILQIKDTGDFQILHKLR